MKRQLTGLFISVLIFISVIGTPIVAAQAASAGSAQRASIRATQRAGDVPLDIHLRYSDGSAVSGESITLQRLPDLQEMSCTTDGNGRCSWSVARGLYQLIFSQPLDPVSALAVAEGGLDGFGLTVGDAPITYDFTFHHDNHVYFDADPQAAVPDPIIPTADSLHGGVVPTAVSTTAVNLTTIGTMAVTLTAVPSTSVGIAAITPLPEEDTPSQDMPLSDEADAAGVQVGDSDPMNPFWQLLLVIMLGLVLGGGLHLWSRKRQQKAVQAAEQLEVEQRLSTFILSPQTGADVSTTTQSSTPGASEC